MTAVPAGDVAAGLADVAALGAYFELTVGEHESTALAGRPDLLRDRIDAVRRRLGSAEPRVAASSFQYEVAERLWSVAVGMWSRHDLVVDLRDVRLCGAGSPAAALHVAAPRAWHAGGDPTAELAAQVLGRLAALHETLRQVTPVATGLLWGNAATGLVLAANQVQPEDARRRAVSAARELLDHPPLRGLVDGPVEGTFRRRTCCLYYRTRDPRPCPDCPLVDSPVIRRFAGASDTAR